VSGPSVIHVKVKSVAGKVTVKPVVGTRSRVKVSVSQSVTKSAGLVAGPRGPRGEDGAALPPGGTDGQVLTKLSSTDSDADWETISFVDDKTFKQDFTNTNSVIVTHNLGKYPAVMVINSAGDEVFGDINYVSASLVVVSFSASFSGSVLCN
jgi:hypothetical protein